MLLLLASALAAPCDKSVLGPALTQVENGYLRGDAAELGRGIRVARKHIRCDVTPELAARFHRSNALQAALANDWSGAELHLRAALAAAPFEGPLVDGDQRLELAWHRAQEQPIVWKPASLGMVNGLELGLRPDVPYLGSKSSSSPGPIIRWVGVGTAVLAVGLYTGSTVSRARYERVRGGPSSEVLPAYRTTNTLFFGAVGTGVVSAGLIGASFTL